jgi:hypothetical protein
LVFKGFSESLEGSIEKISQLLKDGNYKHSFATGSSMGAYGSVLIGSQVPLNTIIGFGTEIITGLPCGFSEQGLPNLVEYIKTSPSDFLFVVGSLSPVDIYSASKVASLPNVEIVIVDNAGHNVVGYLNNMNKLQDIYACSPNIKEIHKLDCFMTNKQEILDYFSSCEDDKDFIKACIYYFENYIYTQKSSSQIFDYIVFLKKSRQYAYLINFLHNHSDDLKVSLSKTHDTVAYSLMKLKRYTECIEYTNFTSKYLKNIDATSALYYNSYCNMRLNRMEKARVSISKAITLAENNQMPPNIISAYKKFSKNLEPENSH